VANPLQFFFDQHIHGGVASGLRQHGIEVLTAQEAGRCGLPVADQLAFATTQERVLVTHDTDYLVLAASGVQHAGIAWADATKYRNLVGPLIQMLMLLHGVLDRDDMRNRVEYL
jgi:predicted nuclease of predicted toxin-antitoxin system